MAGRGGGAGGPYLHALVIAVGHHDAAAARGGDALEVGELALLPAAAPWGGRGSGAGGIGGVRGQVGLRGQRVQGGSGSQGGQ